MNKVKVVFLAALATALVPAVKAGPVMSGVATCDSRDPSGTFSVTGLPTCSLTSPGGANVQGYVYVTEQNDGYNYILSVDASATARPSTLGFTTEAGYDQTFTDADYLSTAGQVRQGFLAYSISVTTVEGAAGDEYARASVGNYVSCSSDPSGLPPNCSGSGRSRALSATIPVTLGIAFTPSVGFSLLEVGSGNWGISSGAAVARLSFSFFEADGVTPVAFAPAPVPTPEPRTWMLVSAGLMLLAVKGRLKEEPLA